MSREKPVCVSVPLRQGEQALKALRRIGELDPSFKIARSGGFLVIPVKDLGKSMQILEQSGIEARPECIAKPERREGMERWEPKAPYVLIGDIALVNPIKGIDDIDYYRGAAREILQHVKKVRAVWMKKRTTGAFRLPELIHLAGEERTETEAREYGLRFRLDIARVYYNPRLSYEHRSIAEQVNDGSTVLDMFSGIGGFTIHIAALRNARVLAVDINPYAAAYAAINARINSKRLKGRIAVIAGDADKLPDVHEPVFDVIIMNHPTGARQYGFPACRMVNKKARIFYYTLQISPLEASEEASMVFSSHCRRVDITGVREVLDYSPEQRIYRVEVDVAV